jgi:hypothetical protein
MALQGLDYGLGSTIFSSSRIALPIDPETISPVSCAMGRGFPFVANDRSSRHKYSADIQPPRTVNIGSRAQLHDLGTTQAHSDLEFPPVNFVGGFRSVRR